MTEKEDFTLNNPIMFDWENKRCRCIPIPYENKQKRFIICIDSNNLKSLWDDKCDEPLLFLNREDRIEGIDEVCSLLNELSDENEQLNFELKECREHKLFSRRQLEEENEQLKHNNKMLSMKMSEVSTKYRLLKEFSDDTNPNEAVKTVLHELMMITKEYR